MKFRVGDTFRHPLARAPGWHPKCHVRGIVDGKLVVRWFGRRKQWWHYEVMDPDLLEMAERMEK